MTPQQTQDTINLGLGVFALLVIFFLIWIIYRQCEGLKDASENIKQWEDSYQKLHDQNVVDITKLQREKKALETMVNNLKNNK